MKRVSLILILSFAIINSIFTQCNCGPLPDPGITESIVYVNNVSELQNAIDNSSDITTIYLNSGTYYISNQSYIIVNKPNITIRSSSGNRSDVIVQGNGMDAPGIEIGFYIDGDNITIADLTVRDVANHGFFVNPGSDNCLFHNVRGLDCGEQIFKATGDSPKNDGIIECSTFEFTTTLDDGDDGWYTNGIDLLNCHNWIIRDNIIKNIKHNPSITSTLAGPAILIWYSSSNTIIERNRIIECDFGISFGNSGQGEISHTGGIIRNNFIIGYSESDFGIGLTFAPDAKVINNTIYSPGGWPYSIEARFPETNNCIIMNNFCDEEIFDDRDGASCELTTNDITASSSDFIDIDNADLHLASSSVSAINSGTSSEDRINDIDCLGIIGVPDIGADEFQITTETNEIIGNKIRVFPNPSMGRISISGEQIDKIFLYDSHMRIIDKIFNSDYNINFALDIRNKGMYFLKIITDDEIIIKKVVIE